MGIVRKNHSTHTNFYMFILQIAIYINRPTLKHLYGKSWEKRQRSAQGLTLAESEPKMVIITSNKIHTHIHILMLYRALYVLIIILFSGNME